MDEKRCPRCAQLEKALRNLVEECASDCSHSTCAEGRAALLVKDSEEARCGRLMEFDEYGGTECDGPKPCPLHDALGYSRSHSRVEVLEKALGALRAAARGAWEAAKKIRFVDDGAGGRFESSMVALGNALRAEVAPGSTAPCAPTGGEK